MGLTYKQSGVNVTTADSFIERVKPLIVSTHKYWIGDDPENNQILNDVGGFAAALKTCGVILGASMDGVGTKAWTAGAFDHLDTIGEDLVAMNVNDLWATMEPARTFLLDYYATKKLYIQDGEKIIKGIVQGCTLGSTALVGGETAELPIKQSSSEHELVAVIIGVALSTPPMESAVMRPHLRIKKGMGIFGYPSRGVHSNGFSLIHKAFGIDFTQPREVLQKLYAHYDELGRTLGEELMKPTPIWQEKMTRMRAAYPRIAGFAHITGGGMHRNIPRILPANCSAVVRLDTWPRQPIFDLIGKVGQVSEGEMLRALNCGIGLIAISPDNLTPAGFYHIGDIVPGVRKIEFVH